MQETREESLPRGGLFSFPGDDSYRLLMCRNIKTLFNFDPPATDDEIRAAALQFVRKLAGTQRPARDNHAAFNTAIEQIFVASRTLLDTMTPHGPARDRAVEALKAKQRSALRFRKAEPADKTPSPLG